MEKEQLLVCPICDMPYHSKYIYGTPWELSKGSARSSAKLLSKAVGFVEGVLGRQGRIVQANHVDFSHKGVLAHAFDIGLAVGTSVLAARDGIVVDACDKFKKGGLKEELKSKANFVIIRHRDNTYGRYFHLKHGSIIVKKGDYVGKGQIIAQSGSTGYSGGPHLHFDVADTYVKEVAQARIIFDNLSGSKFKALEVAVANISGKLPSKEEMASFRLLKADPFLCTEELLESEPLPEDTALICLRGGIPFLRKAEIAQSAGASALIIIDNDKTHFEVLRDIGVETGFLDENQLNKKSFPNQMKESLREIESFVVNIPVIFVSPKTGELLLKGATSARNSWKLQLTTHPFYNAQPQYPYRKAVTLPAFLEGVKG